MKKFKPEFFGKYLLLEKLAAGGMAEVFLARAPGASGIGKIIAMKRILPQFSDNQEFIDMFKSEAKIAINLSHSSVVSIYEFGIENQQLYLTMEYVEGKNLRQLLNHLKKQEKKLTVEQVVYIIKQVAAGLEHAHKCIDGSTGKPLNIIHRDMSPQNIMTSYNGEIKVVDFGIAKAESQIEKTKAGTLKGKFGYMSPEQAQGLEVDIRTDIFSLGIVLWELLAGERLFIANNEINTLRKIRDCNVPSIKKINPAVPDELERIVNKSLTKDRNLRYQTCSELYKDLNRFLNTTYPDFSNHDFALFISNIYANDIVEIRNRIVEYSKIPFKSAENDKERSEFLELMTNTSPVELDKTNATDAQNRGFSTESVQSRLDFSKARLKSDNPFYRSSYHKKDMTRTNVRGTNRSSVRSVSVIQKPNNNTRTSVKHTHQRKDKSFLAPIILILLLLGGGYYFMGGFDSGVNEDVISQNQNDENNEFEDSGEETLASEKEAEKVAEETIKVVINSKPSGAKIFLNGKDLQRITPAQIDIPFNKPFDLKLTKKKFLNLEKKNFIVKTKATRSLNNTLQVANIAYIDIDVRPLKKANIYINNQKLTETDFPLENYAVPSGKKLKIKAINPYNKMVKYKTLTLDNGQKKSLHFDLTTRRRPTNNR